VLRFHTRVWMWTVSVKQILESVCFRSSWIRDELRVR
jgi:hypothetical protein